MEIVTDTSVILAVILEEPEKKDIVRLTASHEIVGPESIRWEIGNAFSAMLKRKRLSIEIALKGLELFHSIPIRYLDVDHSRALRIAGEQNIYAYDAYFLECASRLRKPLLTLDIAMLQNARKLGIETLEVPK